jgi:hypothetical protein
VASAVLSDNSISAGGILILLCRQPTSCRDIRFFVGSAAEARYNIWRFGFGPREGMGLLKSGEEWLRDPETWINYPPMVLNCVCRH